MPWSNENKSCMRVDESWEAKVAWELMRVKKQEFAWEFSQLSCPGQTRTRVEWELRSESLYESFSTLMPWSVREQELHESWWELMRVEKQELHELMRVKKQEFAWEFSQLSCPGQTRTRVAWELRSESLHESFLNSHAPVKREQELHESWEARVCMRVFSTLMPWSVREQELHESWEARVCMRVVELRSESLYESWWELTSESLHESFLNSHALVKREQELHETAGLKISFTRPYDKMSDDCKFGSDMCMMMSDDLQFSLAPKLVWMTRINISTMY
jgi:hypothetical protein